MKGVTLMAILAISSLGAGTFVAAQNAAPAGPPAPAAPARSNSAAAFPARVTDPAAVGRGKVLFATNNCTFCHGTDARGGDGGGPNLLPSSKVLNDQHGEILGPFLRTGVPGTAMPAFSSLTDSEVGDIAEFLHSFGLDSRDPARSAPTTIITGNAKAGQAYFKTNCASCHSATGDLAHLATKYPAERTLQQNWLAPPTKLPTKARVTYANGRTIEGDLITADEFTITLRTPDGRRTLARNGVEPKFEKTDPVAAHKAMLRKYTDRNIHDVTAYLAGLK